ncbi:Shr3 amino acid permease chaperone [Gautieria morchelliformis]|nr:Shr3 amino acid permease chaperone [Gautieria morchelliformis]
MLRASLVVCTTSFLIGILATHWIADGLTLWKSPPTDTHLYTSAAYYSLLAQAPHGMGVAVTAVALTGATSILWSLWDGRAGNLMFDGASFFLYGCAFVVYVFSVVPNLTKHFSTPLPSSHKTTFPSELRAPTLELASSHLVCSVALTGVLVLQAGRWWAEGEDESVHIIFPGG